MKHSSCKLILASRSPRRRQLLTEAGYQFEVLPPDELIEYAADLRKTPRELVSDLAYQKAADVARRTDEGIVLACDTVVEYRGQILGKPQDRDDARRMLQLLRGRAHHVYSGLCLWRRPDNRTLVEVDVTKLKMDPRSDADLEQYLDTGQWQGKAGAFGYQDRLGWIRIVTGSESNVVGLPMELLTKMLLKLDGE